MAFTLKLDSSGAQKWNKTYVGNINGSQANAIILDTYSNVYTCGYSYQYSNSHAHKDFFTLKYTSSGIEKWVRRYNTDTMMRSIYDAQSIVIDNYSNVYVTGLYSPDENTAGKLCIVKYSVTGDLLWSQKDSSQGTVGKASMDIDRDNNFYIGVAYNETSFVTLKYDTAGTLKWEENHTTYGMPYDLKVNEDFSVYLTGGFGAMITLKYTQTTGINGLSSVAPSKIKLYQNYPNPFNPITKIKFELPMSSFVTLKVYNSAGSEVATLVDQILHCGVYETVWDAKNYSSGIYFVKLKGNNFSRSIKIALIR
jgi:hypothetical protein